jgi:hypothetical protein
MAELTYVELKINLVHYFVASEKYKAEKGSSENVTYLLNKNNKHQLIVLSLIDFDEKKIDEIAKTLKSAKHDKVEVLKIALFKTTKTDNTIVIGEPVFYKDELKELFPKLANFDLRKNKSDDEEEISDEEIAEMLSNPEKAQNKELRELTSKIKQGFTPVTWLFTILFFILPIASFALSFWFSAKGSSYLRVGVVSSLFFGGSDRNLTVLAGQWWRLLTYGFNAGTGDSFLGLIESVIVGMLIFSTSRYVEVVTGSLKLIISIMVAYVLAGFATTALPITVIGGSYVILAALVGVLGFSTAKKKTPVSIISKGKLIVPVIALILLPLFDSNFMNYLLLIFGAGFSGSIMFFWNYNYKSVSFDIAAPAITLGVGIILPIVLIFAYSPIPAISEADVYTIQSYLEQGWIKTTNSGTDVLHSIGWGSLGFDLRSYDDGSLYYVVLDSGVHR